jgi:hypothetical protein
VGCRSGCRQVGRACREHSCHHEQRCHETTRKSAHEKSLRSVNGGRPRVRGARALPRPAGRWSEAGRPRADAIARATGTRRTGSVAVTGAVRPSGRAGRAPRSAGTLLSI